MLIWQIWWHLTRLWPAASSTAQRGSQVSFSLPPSIPRCRTPPLPGAYRRSNPTLCRSQHEGAKEGFLHAMFEARCVSNLHGGWDDEGGEGDKELGAH